MADPDVLGTFLGARLERAVPHEPGPRADRPVGRLRPADPDRVRPGPRPRPGRGRQGRRARAAPRRDGDAVRRHPARRDEHVDDDQRDGDVAARHVPRARRRAGRAVRAAPGHDAERHPEGVPVARHVHLPARGVEAPDRRPHRVHGQARARVEPDQRLPVPPAGSGRVAGAGTRVRARERDRGARCRARVGSDPRRRVPASRRTHLVLHRRRRPLRRRDVQDAGVHADVGRHLPHALRRAGREAAPLPLRHAGELARAHRRAAREQRAAHRARDARRHAFEGRARRARSSFRAGTRRSACRHRGISSGRCASSRCSRTNRTCSSTATCSTARRSSRPRSPNCATRPRPSCNGSSTAAARSR